MAKKSKQALIAELKAAGIEVDETMSDQKVREIANLSRLSDEDTKKPEVVEDNVAGPVAGSNPDFLSQHLLGGTELNSSVIVGTDNVAQGVVYVIGFVQSLSSVPQFF